MSLTKATYSMIQGSWVNVFDHMTPAEISAVSSGTGINVTNAIKAAVNAAASNGTVYFPAGLYICDPITWNVGANPALSNKIFIGASSAYTDGYQSSTQQQTRIVASGACAVFWFVNYAHRFTMQDMVLDGNGVSDIVMHLQQGCTKHTYTNVSFQNATPATGIIFFLGDPVINIQVDMIEFINCVFNQSPGFAQAAVGIKLQSTNTFLITFRRCSITGTEICVLLRGVNTINFQSCDIAYGSYGFYVQGSTSGLTIVDSYTESTAGIAFLTYVDQVFGPVRTHVIERNTIQGVANPLIIDPKVPVVIRNNTMAGASGYIQINPEVPGSYVPPVIENNMFTQGTGINDLSSKAVCFNNFSAGVALADANYATYSQGTWSPTAGVGLTVVGAFTSSGTWTRVGRQVTISGTVTGATSVAVTAAGVITNNLPFTAGTAGHGSATNAANTAFASVICTTTNVTSAGAIAATATITFSATYFV